MRFKIGDTVTVTPGYSMYRGEMGAIADRPARRSWRIRWPDGYAYVYHESEIVPLRKKCVFEEEA